MIIRTHTKSFAFRGFFDAKFKVKKSVDDSAIYLETNLSDDEFDRLVDSGMSYDEIARQYFKVDVSDRRTIYKRYGVIE